MKKTITMILLILAISTICSAQIVNGERTIIDGKTILRIWGTHQERGFAYGYLQAEEIKEVMEDYIIASVFFNSAYAYGNARTYFESHFEVEEKYHIEATAIIEGISAAGFSIFSDVLSRDLDEIDVLLANSIVDISVVFDNIENPVHCSSISSWGESTIQSPELTGESLITRHLDWNPHQTILDNQLIIASEPSEEDEQNWISFSIAGLMGSLSGVNESGVTAFMNVGSIHNVVNQEDLHPIFLSIRNGIESLDFNQNGECNPGDIASAISAKNNLSGSITHSIASVEKDSSAIVIECNNESGVEVRTSADNSVVTGDNLAATNHFRKLYDPIYCYRYNNIVDSLNVSTNISSERSWDLLCGAAGVTGNLQTIQFVPNSGKILWATSPDYTQPAFTQEPTEFYFDEFFDPISVEENELINDMQIIAYPNPFQQGTTISFSVTQTFSFVEIAIYNIKGQKVKSFPSSQFTSSPIHHIYWNGDDDNEKPVSSGIYFLNLQTENDFMIEKLLFIK